MIFENELINPVYWTEALLFLRKHGFYDVHVHARDMKQWKKFMIEKWFGLAKEYGVRFGAFMPNTDPTIINEIILKRYIKIAEKADNKGVEFKIWIGLTDNPEQIREAVALCKKYKKYVIGLKMYAGTSTGDLGLVEEWQQEIVYKTLKDENFDGILAIHCEEDELMYPKKHDPQRSAESWAKVRPEESEISSVNQNIRLAKKYDFPGWLHICHISSHISVLDINYARKQGMKISCGATIQHLIFDVEQIARMNKEDSIELKCNPSIKGADNRLWLLKYLRLGLIDIIESDFAPHDEESKKNGASGVYNYPFLPMLIIELWRYGFSDKRIIELINKKPREIFLGERF